MKKKNTKNKKFDIDEYLKNNTVVYNNEKYLSLNKRNGNNNNGYIKIGEIGEISAIHAGHLKALEYSCKGYIITLCMYEFIENKMKVETYNSVFSGTEMINYYPITNVIIKPELRQYIIDKCYENNIEMFV